MTANFTRIPAEEQRRILDVCLDEFARHGYGGASTNAIVKKAGIPKGTLFFYFGSKTELFFYLVDRAVESYRQGVSEDIIALPPDLFDRLLYLGRQRMRFAQREPRLYGLLFNAFINLPPDLAAEMRTRYPGYQDAGLGLLRDGLDLTRFRPGVDVDRAIGMIQLLMEGLLNRSLDRLQTLSPEASLGFIEDLTREVEQYFQMIRLGIYRD